MHPWLEVARNEIEEKFEEWKGNLHGPPRIVFIFAVAQFFFFMLTNLLGVGQSWCDISGGSGAVFLMCGSCGSGGLGWGGAVLLLLCLGVAGCGIAAAVTRANRLCFAFAMTSFGLCFILGVSSLITGIEVHYIRLAAQYATEPTCRSIGDSMVSTTIARALLFAISTLLTLGAGWYSYTAADRLEFEPIGDHYAAVSRSDAL